MSFIGESFSTAIALLLALDSEVLTTVWTSLWVSVVAILIAMVAAVPLGGVIALRGFCGKRLVLTLLNTLMALPTVVVGLLVYGLISRQGPLGEFGLLFTPWAMVIGQVVLAVPIVAHYTVAAVAGADPRILPTARTLGAGPVRSVLQLLLEVRFGIIAAVVAGFGRVIAEVGVAMMLGGNIRGYTRTMTTAIALETSKGEFAFGLALGLVLMAVALLVNLFLNLLQQR
ncbi:ABC transporter permease [Trichloromonas sp.]|uniref:ABC transporter permease n=1 Tax=Trichloromonas sp. TaxID=3069249 RepID=UPI003D8174F7